jgi:hypothetical protein
VRSVAARRPSSSQLHSRGLAEPFDGGVALTRSATNSRSLVRLLRGVVADAFYISETEAEDLIQGRVLLSLLWRRSGTYPRGGLEQSGCPTPVRQKSRWVPSSCSEDLCGYLLAAQALMRLGGLRCLIRAENTLYFDWCASVPLLGRQPFFTFPGPRTLALSSLDLCFRLALLTASLRKAPEGDRYSESWPVCGMQACSDAGTEWLATGLSATPAQGRSTAPPSAKRSRLRCLARTTAACSSLPGPCRDASRRGQPNVGVLASVGESVWREQVQHAEEMHVYVLQQLLRW